MKFVLELILATIIIFFVWNIMKRLFLSSFYKFPKQNPQQQKPAESKKNIDKNLKWDAETVDYEEVKEEKQTK